MVGRFCLCRFFLFGGVVICCFFFRLICLSAWFVVLVFGVRRCGDFGGCVGAVLAAVLCFVVCGSLLLFCWCS